MKKRKAEKKRIQKIQPTIQDAENAIHLQFIQFEEMCKDKYSKTITTYQTI